MKEYLKDDNFILINITETWLNNSIKEDADIEGYKTFRGDRKGKKCGGTAIYLLDSLDAELICEMSHEKCEMVAINIPDIQTVNIVIYRPPKTKLNQFKIILNKIKEILDKLEKPDPTILLSGDFNFPFVKWKRTSDNSCSWKYIPYANATSDEKDQFEMLMDICNYQCMLQIIEEPTRNQNVLDLVFTNETSLATMIEVNKSKLSDHNSIEISTNYTLEEQTNANEVQENQNNILRSLNFHAKSIDWKEINKSIKEVSWEENFENKDTLDSNKEFEDKVTEICIKNIPKKLHQRNTRRIPKERKKLLNRLKMLKRDKHRAYSKGKKKTLEKKIIETKENLIKCRRKEKLENEKKAIDCMEQNPRMFYAFINKQKNRKNEIGPFKDGNEYIYDGKEICNSLKKEYTSQYSEKTPRENENIFEDSDTDDLCDFDFGEENIEDGIKELNENSSAGPDGLPAIFLKKTQESISRPLTLILRKSLDECKIPDNYKLAFVTPIHKGGSKQKPENYRPVSLTSHVMKVFERVKKKILKHLIEKQKFNKGQHGFVPGRSCQTQLLAHYNDVYEALIEGKRLDTVFLDFAKAFDKVDHDILLEKVKAHNINGKVGKWIEEFLRNRKFRVVANGNMSEEEVVTSGVPQGTV